jgi:predicted ATPase
MDSGRVKPQQSRTATGDAVTGQSSTPPEAASIRREGEYWAITYAGATLRLRDSKGLCYIAELVAYPEHSFHALDLAAGTRTGSVGQGEWSEQSSARKAYVEGNSPHQPISDSAGQMLDERAKRAYRLRVTELRSVLDDAKALGKVREAEDAEREILALTRELARAVGLSGRDRPTASTSERARISVGRAIRSVIDRIDRTGSALGPVLRATIKTGNFCCYTPDPAHSVIWDVATAPLSSCAPGTSNSTSPDEVIRRDIRIAPTTAIFSYDTTFVGRKTERDSLEALLDRARGGRGGLSLISGSPGVGKTRLAAELATLGAKRGMTVLLGHCYERDEALPYHPFVGAFEMVQVRLRRPSELRELLGEGAPELALLMPQLRRLFPDIDLPAGLPPDQARRSLFAAVCGFLSRLAGARGAVLILDDLQWADESTLRLLAYLVPKVAELPVLVIGTYRDAGLRNDSPLALTIEELLRARRVELVRLSGLTQELTAQMLEGLASQPAPLPLVAAVFAETEGNPFFIEECFKHLVEKGLLFDEAHRFLPALTINELSVPENVRLVVGRRLSMLDPATHSTLAAAAVVGRAFSFELLSNMLGGDTERLLRAMDEAERAGIIRSATDLPESRLAFSHELIRQTLLAEMSSPRRQRMHLAVVDAVERMYAATVEDHAAELAHHLVMAGAAAPPEQTLRHLASAAQQAIDRSAYTEALNLLNAALGVTERLADQSIRQREELRVRCMIGLPLLVNEGFSSQELEQSNLRVLELCRQVEDRSLVLSALTGVWNIAADGGSLARAREVSTGMMRLVDDSSPSSWQVQANYTAGSTMFFCGDMLGARSHFQKVASLYTPAEHRARYRPLVSEPGVVSLAHGALVSWRLGLPDQALQTCHRALELGREIAHPASLAHALFHAAEIRQFRGEYDLVREPAEASIALSTDKGLTYWLGLSTATLGASLASMGRLEEGIALIVRGVDIFGGTGTQLDLPYAMRILAEAYLLAGRLDDALHAIDQTLAAVELSGARLEEAELYRLKGEAMLAPVSPSPAEAAACFERSIEIARRQGSRSWELRATISLARLLWRTGGREQAHSMLAEVYGGFSEGFDTRDLKEAKALLDEFGA